MLGGESTWRSLQIISHRVMTPVLFVFVFRVIEKICRAHSGRHGAAALHKVNFLVFVSALLRWPFKGWNIPHFQLWGESGPVSSSPGIYLVLVEVVLLPKRIFSMAGLHYLRMAFIAYYITGPGQTEIQHSMKQCQTVSQ